ncbi:MAG TPA: hypothetical protein VMD59_20850 [Acidimicrobiales bacterium]|nr:hypothetical protein [Acidimicrobiales bacterium]
MPVASARSSACSSDVGGEVRRLLDEADPSRCDVARFALRDTSLDEVFLQLTGGSAGTAGSEHARV